MKTKKEGSLNEMIIVRTHDVVLDDDYSEWIRDLKDRYRKSQVKAAVKVNAEQLLFNWQLGRDLVEKKAEEKWGSGVVEQVSLDLQNAFPGAKGFSTTNLWYMKKWYRFYTAGADSSIFESIGANNDSPQKLHQTGGETGFPVIFGLVPWRHHVEIITKCKSVNEALFYIRKTVEEGWSRNTLDNCIRSDMYHSMGSAVTNFEEELPAAQSDLAQELLKQNYDLGFISLPRNYKEKDIEDAIEERISRFLLELGQGWAFVGRQKELIIAGKSRRIDLLFYHIYLRSYVVLELKTEEFQPEFAGKLNFYVNAVDEIVKRDSDNQTIGLLICKEADRTEVQMAFQGVTTPMGVATYDNVRYKEIREYLPTAEEIRQQVELAEKEYLTELKTEGKEDIKDQ